MMLLATDLTRLFPASRERVFRALTTPEDLVRWWGPNAAAEVDLRVGGHFRLHMRMADGMELAAVGTYREIAVPERLVCTWAWEGEEARETLVTMTFREVDGQTELKLVHTGFATAEAAENHRLGWNDCLDRMARMLA